MIPREVLKAIRRIEIRTRRLVNQGLGGEYHSVFKGRGMEFSEVREYQPGDDVRTIDWNVTSRTGSLHVKKYVEERELTVMLAVDVSRSGDFGTGGRTKLETAAEVASVLAFSAVRNNDRVGLLLFTDRVESHVPPSKGADHALRVVRDVLLHEPQGTGTDLGGALRTLTAASRKRSVVFLLSDFLAEGYEFPLRVAARKHDLVAVCVEDPRESELPDVGLLHARDAESGELLLVDTSDARVRRAHAAAHLARKDAREALFRRVGVDVVRVRTDLPYDVPLARFFHLRERKLRMA